jgi:hypothetical protein
MKLEQSVLCVKEIERNQPEGRHLAEPRGMTLVPRQAEKAMKDVGRWSRTIVTEIE